MTPALESGTAAVPCPPNGAEGETSAIVVEHLYKKFGDFTADEDLSFTVGRNEIFGILGPNGAGKSTLVRMLTTLIKPTSGRALVMGYDVVRCTEDVRGEIGVIPQASTIDLDLSAWESLDLYGKFYGMGRRQRRERSAELLQAVGLWEWKDKVAGTYSGGMRRRLEIARGLINRPRVFFLDEPTTGLDPQSRRVIWELLETLRSEGNLAVLICTHYMDEADRLCDRLAIIDHGRIQALGSPRELKASVPGEEVLIVQFFQGIGPEMVSALAQPAEVTKASMEDEHRVRLVLAGDVAPLDEILQIARKLGNKVQSVSVQEPSLEDVFIHYTGRALRDTVTRDYVRMMPPARS
jgi:ABC-2 type transport system ATP-binding protein